MMMGMRLGLIRGAAALLLAAALLPACGAGGGGGGGGGGGSAGSVPKPSDPVFDPADFATYTLTLNAADWTALENGDDTTWRTATLAWGGETLLQVAVRATNAPSGMTPKPSLRFKFDEFVPDRKWRTLTHLNLDAMTGDPTFLRERIGLWTYRQSGVPAPRSVHARLVVNGASKGVYEVREVVSKAFAKYHWGNNDGNLYEIHKIGSMPNLDHYAWKGSSPGSYVPVPWEPKTNETGGNYGDVVALCDVFNNAPASSRRTQLAALIDLSDFLGYLAGVTAIADSDGLTGDSGPNNHFWYHREENNQMEVIAWDPDRSFGYPQLDGTFNTTRGLWAGFTKTAATSWIQAEATAAASYQDKVRKVRDEAFSILAIQIDYAYAQIKDAVHADPNKPMTNAEFDSGPAALKQWISNRIAYLDSVLPPRPSPAAGDNAAFVSQSGVPSTLGAGQTATVSVTMKNTGTTTWTAAGEYKLTSRAPRNNLIWGDNRIKLDPSESIAKDQERTFVFTIVAPSVAGSYVFQWSMVNDSPGGGGAVFGATSTAVSITVN
jgi:spore coat protein CotH